MKIALINGSPKFKNSASEIVLNMLKQLLPEEHEVKEYHFGNYKIDDCDLAEISESNVLVFAFPLYVDGLPSHLVSCLYEMERYFNTKPSAKITVYSLANNGFYEGHQNALALDMMKNWCDKAKLHWGQGIGIGSGGMLPMMAGVADGKGPRKNLSKALHTMADNISTCTAAENMLICPNFPRLLYKLAAEMGWRQQIKANGLKRKDLFMER